MGNYQRKFNMKLYTEFFCEKILKQFLSDNKSIFKKCGIVLVVLVFGSLGC